MKREDGAFGARERRGWRRSLDRIEGQIRSYRIWAGGGGGFLAPSIVDLLSYSGGAREVLQCPVQWASAETGIA